MQQMMRPALWLVGLTLGLILTGGARVTQWQAVHLELWNLRMQWRLNQNLKTTINHVTYIENHQYRQKKMPYNEPPKQ